MVGTYIEILRLVVGESSGLLRTNREISLSYSLKTICSRYAKSSLGIERLSSSQQISPSFWHRLVAEVYKSWWPPTITVRYRSLDIMYSYTLYHLITHPTRLNSNSAFLIDNIFTNNLGNKSFSGLSLTDISDYLPIFPIFRISMKAPSFFRDDSKWMFCSLTKLSNISWSEFKVIDITDPSNACDSFFDKISTAYNSCFPLRRARKWSNS